MPGMLRTWILVAWLFAALTVRAQSPDDIYIQIYNSMQQADTFNQTGQLRSAAEKYRDVDTALKRFQKAYPTWNPRIIKFRQSYVAERLESLAKFVPPPVAAPTGPAANFQISSKRPVNPDQVQALSDEIRRLESEKTTLEEKLREALSVKPAATDTSETNERIAAVEKERDLLRATLQQLQSIQEAQENAPRNAADAKRIKELEEERDDLKKRLESQEARRQSELKEAQAKFRELEELNADRELLIRKQKEALQLAQEIGGGQLSKNDAKKLKKLEEEKVDLEKRFEDARKEMIEMQTEREQRIRAHESALSRIKELEKERDNLQKRLQFVEVMSPEKKETLERENVQLRSRIEAYEARPAPFTAEELALFKKPEEPTQPKSFVVTAQLTKDLPSKTKSLVADADKDFAAQRFEAAEKKYQEALTHSADNVYALANLASTQIELNRMDDAEQTLKKALEKDARDAFSLLLMGKLKMAKNNFDEALDALSRSAQVNPNSAETQNYLGIVLSEKGQRVSAEAALRKAIQIQPSYASAHHNLAIIYATQKPPFLELAKWHYEKALTLGHAKNRDLEKLMAGN